MVEEALVRIWVRNLKDSIGKNRMAVQEDFNLLFIILFIYFFLWWCCGIEQESHVRRTSPCEKGELVKAKGTFNSTFYI